VHRRPRLILIAALAAVVALTAAGTAWWWLHRPVRVDPPTAASDPACTALARRLPATVQGNARVATSSDSPAVAAWGDPAVIWRCGVAPPGPTTDECIEVDGVDWVRHPLSDGQSFTTFGRDPAVQVLVPHDYAPEPLLLPPFSRAVSVLPQGTLRCR